MVFSYFNVSFCPFFVIGLLSGIYLHTESLVQLFNVPVAQWLEHCVSTQRLWVRFPGNTHTDNTNVLHECSVSRLG